MNKLAAKVLDGVDAARAGTRGAVRSFKEQSVFTQRRAMVIAAYVVAVVASVIVIPPQGEKNPLGAKIKVDAVPFGSRMKSYVEITNEGSKEWAEATVYIKGSFTRPDGRTRVDGRWRHISKWRRFEKKNVMPEQFKDNDGFSPELDVKIDEVRVKVGSDEYVKPWPPPR